jgi:hypothetical protein
MKQPIKPEELTTLKRHQLPDEVIDACNELIALKWTGSCSTFTQDKFIDTILQKRKENGRSEITRTEIFDRHYLDIEDIYKEEGWLVEYDKPAYNESYPASFTFRKGK